MMRSRLSRELLALLAGLIAMAICAWPAIAQSVPAYDSSAGMLKIGKDEDRPDAEIFHADYIRKGANPTTRPVTFLINGGPGGCQHLSAHLGDRADDGGDSWRWQFPVGSGPAAAQSGQLDQFHRSGVH